MRLVESFFIRIFKSVVTLSVSRQLDFLRVRTACPIQLYVVFTLGLPRRIHLTDPKTMTKNDKCFTTMYIWPSEVEVHSRYELYRLVAVGPSNPLSWLARCALSAKTCGKQKHMIAQGAQSWKIVTSLVPRAQDRHIFPKSYQHLQRFWHVEVHVPTHTSVPFIIRW